MRRPLLDPRALRGENRLVHDKLWRSSGMCSSGLTGADMRTVLFGIVCLLHACAAPTGPSEPTYLTSPATRDAGLPFSEAVRVGPLLFVSGQIGARPGSPTVVPGGIEPEARQALENIAEVLRRNGSSMDRVVKCTVFLADVAEWAAFNAVYVEFFDPDALPARSALGANGLAAGARVEVECIAAAAR